MKKFKLITVILLLSISMFNIPVSQAYTTSQREFESQQYKWVKQIRERTTTASADFYESYKNSIVWNFNDNEYNVLEGSSTYNKYVGASVTFTATASSITINLKAKVTSTYSGARAMYASVNIEDAMNYNEWDRVGNVQLVTKSTSYTEVSMIFTGLTINQDYELFFFYSDGWSADYNTQISVQNFEFAKRDFTFQGKIWTKQIREQTSTASADLYESYKSSVKWLYRGNEISTQEYTGTYRKYVGVSTAVVPKSSIYTITLDATVTSGHSSPRKMYASMNIEDAMSYNEWDQVGPAQLVTTGSSNNKILTFTGLTAGQPYELFFFYSDSWSYNWQTKITQNNFNFPTEPQLSISSSNHNTISKGTGTSFTYEIKNTGTSGSFYYEVILKSNYYSDYEAIIDIGSRYLQNGNSFFDSIVLSKYFVDYYGDWYALNSGNYYLEVKSNFYTTDTSATVITVNNNGPEEVVFVVVLEDSNYQATVGYSGTTENFLYSAFNTGSYVDVDENIGITGPDVFYANGFEQIINVDFQFKIFSEWQVDSNTNIVDRAKIDARRNLGLKNNWGLSTSTSKINHGFDILLGLTADYNGGVALVSSAGNGGNLLIGGVFQSDTSSLRTKIILVHEMAHTFGAPHLTDLGTYPQGYVMNEGTATQYYDYGFFLFHPDTLSHMNPTKYL